MKIIIKKYGKEFLADLSKPIDISIPLHPRKNQVNCFYAPDLSVEPVKAGDFIGDTRKGGPVNFMNVKLNPHGNGTHTECVGHISKRRISLNKNLKNFHFIAKLHSVSLKTLPNGDQVISKEALVSAFESKDKFEALIIRTIPNNSIKRKKRYSGQNPPYFEKQAMQFLVKKDVQHLLIDLPSVDREVDGGKVQNHKLFWGYPKTDGSNKTITELVYINNKIKDDNYLLNIQITSLELDASPSKPVIYSIKEI
jgi:kynurenine formamidase